jgi:hypothetical protein
MPEARYNDVTPYSLSQNIRSRRSSTRPYPRQSAEPSVALWRSSAVRSIVPRSGLCQPAPPNRPGRR